MPKTHSIVTITMNPALDLACTVENFSIGAVNRVSRAQTDAGGKGVNIAKLLRQFHVPVVATGFLGDVNPHLFELLFREQNITDAFVRVPGETRTDIKVLDPTTQTTTDINFPGLNPTQNHIDRLFKMVETLAQNASTVAIAGSIPAGLSPHIVAELVSMLRTCGVRTVVDTSGPAFLHAVKAIPSLIKPNAFELSEYLGRPVNTPLEIVTEARGLVATGIETVVVSLGEDGALFINEQEALWAKPPRVDVVSTVGAGDAMVSGLCAGIALGKSLAESARLATSLSAAVVTQPGPSLSNLDLAASFESQVTVQSLDF
ncbi:1-phosphofructokinase [Desulfovibrio inopinatus]|uniref:1-phosphofructokinase n=1 Tax=Desulfovibrio inopinatus TaxID=102109 RepID=UPI0003FC2E32|nr:1-phosphofructokinase [Desulfovibrio inopinatus]